MGQYRSDNGRRNGVGQFVHAQKAFSASGADPDVRDLLQDINTVRTAVLGVQGGNEVENGGELVELQRQVKCKWTKKVGGGEIPMFSVGFFICIYAFE